MKIKALLGALIIADALTIIGCVSQPTSPPAPAAQPVAALPAPVPEPVLALPLASTFGGLVPAYNHYDEGLNYITSDHKTLWQARFNDDGTIYNQAFSPGQTTKTHDLIINYLTWDNTAFTARWDPERKLWRHYAWGQYPNGTWHYDSIINYLGHDGRLWTAIRVPRTGKPDEWLHIFMGEPKNPSKNIFDQLGVFKNRNQKSIDTISAGIKVYTALAAIGG